MEVVERQINRIHIMGAPGSGVTTLGRQLANQLGYAFFDSDDYYWFTSDPEPYRRRRNPDHRRALLAADLQNTTHWVLSGSICGWGDVFAPLFDLVVFCHAPAQVRLERIRQREIARYGLERLTEGGDLHHVFHKFLVWAEEYDTHPDRLRSLAAEKDWLKTNIQVPVVFWKEGESTLESLLF